MRHLRRLYGIVVFLPLAMHAQQSKPGTGTQVPSATVSVYLPVGYGSASVNYIRSWTPLEPITNLSVVQNNTSAGVSAMTTQYIDGLGRSLQTVAWKASPNYQDIVTPEVYDSVGRETFSFLPYEASDATGSFKTSPFSAQSSFYTNTYPTDQPAFKGEQIFYGQTQVEASPLERILKTTAPGNSWTGRNNGTSIQYLTNDTSDHVPLWTITLSSPADGANWPVTSATYAPGTLSKTVTTDERGSSVIEYKDMEGQVVEKKVQAASVTSGPYTGWLVTMYVYDVLNQLRVVIPPKAVAKLNNSSWTFTAALIDGLCFRYEYDGKRRPIAKKIPGAGWTWTVYDKRDLPVFTQDSLMSTHNQWLTTLYDSLDRPVMIGMTTYTGGQSQLQHYVDSVTVSPSSSTRTDTLSQVTGTVANLTVGTRQVGVTSYTATSTILFTGNFQSEPTANFIAQIVSPSPATTVVNTKIQCNPIPAGAPFVPLRETFYDGYTWGTTKTYSTNRNSLLTGGSNNSASLDVLPTASSTLTQGLFTGTRTRVLEDSANLTLGGWLESVPFYDNKGRIVQTISDNYKGGKDTLINRYNFSNQVVATYLAHANPQSASSSLRILTTNLYDSVGRLSSVAKEVNEATPSLRNISQYAYTRLNQLKTKQIGSVGSSFLETQAYDHNIRGWLQGINRGYANPTLGISGGGTWFGMDISYDWGFDSTNLTGSVSGIRWRSGGNGEQRAYGYSYDRAKRILFADFNQYFGSTWAKTDPGGSTGGPALNIDFTTQMGDGKTYNTAYDENGNILSMHQMGLLVNASQYIDNLIYTYPSTSTSNQLQAVSDSVAGNDRLGDFTNGYSGTDYAYDGNGNLTQDLNKSMNRVNYTFLNLPYQVSMNPTIGSKGTVTYIYDAAGTKLEKRVHELPDSTDGQVDTYTTVDYVGPFVYSNNVLQFIGQEEGRIRPYTNPPGQVRTDTVVYDYFLKDHLGDTRIVLTDEHRTDPYPMCTMEPGDSAVENLFYAGLDATRTLISNISGYPTDTATKPNANVAAVGGLHNSVHIGPSITLRVMARDTVAIRVSSWYYQGTNQASYLPLPVANLVSALATSLTSAAVAIEGAVTLPSSNLLQPDATNFIFGQSVPHPSNPKAYLNWIFFDDQFRFVSSASGSQQVTPNSGTVNTMVVSSAVAGKSGYVFVYVSNADSLTTVYFDNLQVTLSNGSLTEEEHYYPFGLTMAGISSQALAFGKYNKYRYNGKEQQNKEFSDGSGIEWYDYTYRFFDNQIGRFFSLDRLSAKFPYYSPYQFAGNQVPNAIDLDGLEPLSFHSDQQPYVYSDGRVQSDFTTDDKVLGPITVHPFYDPANKDYFFTTKQGDNNYYWKNIDGENGFSNRDGEVNGSFVPYQTAEERAAEANKQVANIFTYLFGGTLSAIAGGGAAETGIGALASIFAAGGGATISAGTGAVATGGAGIGIEQYLLNGSFEGTTGNNIALGVREGLNAFAESVNATTWEKWGASDFQSQFLDQINNSTTKIYFNLTLEGGEEMNAWQAVQDGSKGLPNAKITNWELFQLYSNPEALSRTTFYYNGQVVPNPFGN